MNRFGKTRIFFATLILSILLIAILKNKTFIRDKLIRHKTTSKKQYIWDESFKVISIKSSIDGTLQKAFVYKTTSQKAKPLAVSLHPWRGSFDQYDTLAYLCKQKNINYIHPDFRGPNNKYEACCSNLALKDIEDAIAYAKANLNVDTSKIYLIGGSGGGYATLMMYMRSKYNIRKYSSWVAISDLYQWYEECIINDDKKAINEIRSCTNSKKMINKEEFNKRSPIKYTTPIWKQKNSQLLIYAGVNDGINGGVQITHSINFYNKVLTDLKITDSSKYISHREKLYLLEHRKTTYNYGKIGSRDIILKKEIPNIKITIFKGGHELLWEQAMDDLLN